MADACLAVGGVSRPASDVQKQNVARNPARVIENDGEMIADSALTIIRLMVSKKGMATRAEIVQALRDDLARFDGPGMH